MDAYIPDDNDLLDEEESLDIPADPFEGLTAGEQDTFFRVLDLVEDEHRLAAIDYFMDHPAKIRAVVDGVKKRKKMIEEKDVAGLQEIFAQEKVQFESLVQEYA